MSDKPETTNIQSLRDALRKEGPVQRSLLRERVTALQNTGTGSNLGDVGAQLSANTAGYTQIRHRLHRGLIDVLNPQAVANASMEQMQVAIEEYVSNALESENLPLSRIERARLLDDLLYEVMGMGPLSPLMSDPTVSDILVNGPHKVYVERHGLLEKVDVNFHDDEHLLLTIERILSRAGRRVDESAPMADSRLPDGSRVNAIISPLSVKGPALSIRRFMRNIMDVRELVDGGSMTLGAAKFLDVAVKAALNIIVSGGTGSGKTTMLNCLSQFIPENERLITVEDTAELQLDHEHIVCLEARTSNTEGRGAVSIRELVRNTLRMRPDRIIVGEVRGAEALDMLQAMNTGHDGSLATLHSNSPRDTLARLETMMLMADLELPQRVIRDQIGSALHLIVHLNRYPDGKRKVSHISELTGTDNGVILMQDIFITKREGNEMRMRGCGIVPAVASLMHERGIEVDPEWFKP